MFIVVLKDVKNNKLSTLNNLVDEIKMYYPILDVHTEEVEKNKFNKGKGTSIIKMQFSK